MATGDASALRVLVTGGTGYIGSHTVCLLIQAGYAVTIIDNLANSNAAVMRRINEITKRPDMCEFVEMDLRDKAALDALFKSRAFDSVIHFAGYKAVGESKAKPMLYYSNNLRGSITLVEAMADAGVKKIVFSSSCTVYGGSPSPLTETSPIGQGITNAYARSKFQIEEMLRDLAEADASWKVCILRYFNPVGAHESGLLGEDPRGIPNCLMPYVLQVLVGRLPKLTVYGSDYETRDGTPTRDYIHVVDVARGHLDALKWMTTTLAATPDARICEAFNFGTGKGTTVFELVHALEKASGKSVAYTVGPRRSGDLTESYCDPTKAATVLGWRAEYDIEKMCADAWRWQSSNPEGYRE